MDSGTSALRRGRAEPQAGGAAATPRKGAPSAGGAPPPLEEVLSGGGGPLTLEAARGSDQRARGPLSEASTALLSGPGDRRLQMGDLA